MACVTVRIPGLLARFTGGERRVAVEAATVEGALDRLLATHPALEPHLLDGAGRLRPHVQLFHEGASVDVGARNAEGARVGDGAAVELADGDEVVVLQAVSGG